MVIARRRVRHGTLVAFLAMATLVGVVSPGAAQQLPRVTRLHPGGLPVGAARVGPPPKTVRQAPRGLLPKLAIPARPLHTHPVVPQRAKTGSRQTGRGSVGPLQLRIPARRFEQLQPPKMVGIQLPAVVHAPQVMKFAPKAIRPPVETFGPDRPHAPKIAKFHFGEAFKPVIPLPPPRVESGPSAVGSKPTETLSAIPINLPFPRPDKGGMAKFRVVGERLVEQAVKPNHKQWVKPDRPKPSGPEGSDRNGVLGDWKGGRVLDDWKTWGQVLDVERGNPFDHPADPLGPSSNGGFGTRGPGTPDGSADPGHGGPILGPLPGPGQLKIVWTEPDEGRGGAKTPDGGPGPINTTKGPAGSDQIGWGSWPGGRGAANKGTRWTRITDYHKGMAEMELFQNLKKMEEGKVPDYEGPGRHYDDPKEYYERQEEEARFRKAQEEWQKEREKMERLKKQLHGSSSGCEGAFDTGGGFEPPTGPADIDKSKAGGSLVIDPAASQWFGGLSGVDPSNHPNHVSNPGFEGARDRVDGGVKHDPTQIRHRRESEGSE